MGLLVGQSQVMPPRKSPKKSSKPASKKSKATNKKPAPAHPKEFAWFLVCRDFNRELARNSMYPRASRNLEVWAQLNDGGGVQVSTELEYWPKHGSKLTGGCRHGLVAVRQDSATLEGVPGLILALSDPMGGGMATREAMKIFHRMNLGGALAHSEAGTSVSVLKFLYCPHWYATSGDTSFGVDWEAVDQPGADHSEAKFKWCTGIERIVRKVLAEIPELFIDTVCMDNYACNDRLDTLSAAELKALSRLEPDDLAAALIKRG